MLLAVLCMGAADPLDVRLPELELMQGMEASWAAERMAMNGVPMSIRTFTSGRSAQRVLEFYERRWQKNGLTPKREAFDGYRTIGAAREDLYFSVQVRDSRGGSEGRITVSRRDYAGDKKTRFPLPRRTQTVSKIDSLDAGTRAESIVAYAPGSALENASWFTNELARQGWSRDPYVPEDTVSEKVLAFQRDTEMCQVTLVPNQPGHRGKTMLLIHWIKGASG